MKKIILTFIILALSFTNTFANENIITNNTNNTIKNTLTPEEDFQYYFFLNNIRDIIKIEKNKKTILQHREYIPLIVKAYKDYKLNKNQISYSEKKKLLDFIQKYNLFLIIQ